MTKYYESEDKIIQINLKDVLPNHDQPRTTFNEKPLAELSQSIRIHGVLEPILVVRTGAGFYKIIAGERRYRAAQMAGLTKIPAIIINGSKEELREIAIIENLHRQQLNPMEEAEAIRLLIETNHLTQEQVADALSRSRSAVTNLLRLLTLPLDVQMMIRDGKLSQGHARTLLSIQDPKALIFMANKCVEEKWSVRALTAELERLARKKPAVKKAAPKVSAYLKDMVKDIERVFQTPVEHKGNDNKGRLIIEYRSTEELNRIYHIVQWIRNKNK